MCTKSFQVLREELKWLGPEPTHYEHEGIHDTTQDGSKCVIHPH